MAVTIRRNERSWAISMISDINIKLNELNLRIVRAGGETTIQDGHTSMFPDVLLYGDEDQTRILQGWELKLPDTSITNTVFIDDAKRKAIALGLNSFFIWNFNAGVLYIKNDNDEFEIKKQWNETNQVRTRADVERYKEQWLPAIENILIEINEFLVTGEIHSAGIGDIVSETIIAYTIERNKLLLSNELYRNSIEDAVMDAYISVWWNECQSEYIADETNKYNAYSKVILLSWLNRIVFAHLIKYYHDAAYEIDMLDYDTSIELANEVFERITGICDFYSIFCNMEYNDILPRETWHDLMDINIFLKNNCIENLDQTVLQNILERTVAVAKRESNGQFTTPETLADILVKLTTIDWTGDSIDPCCGSGTIAKAVLFNKVERLECTQQAKDSTWAADKFSFPLQIANMSMTDARSINIPNRIFRKNVFELNAHEYINITDPTNGIPMPFEIPEFKTIISNLPFIPFEKVEDDKVHIEEIIKEVERETGISLGNRNDYYAFIIFTLYKMLRTDGRLGIITSNSWLGTIAGKEFLEALKYYYKIKQIHISASSRWFHNAKVITTILILSKREVIGDIDDNEETVFCTWNKSLEEIEANERYKTDLVNSALLDREINPGVMTMKHYTQNDIMRICEMNVSLSALFQNISWLLDISDNLIPISKVFKVIRGERRGWDKLFYPENGHGIENCYIKKVLKNGKGIKRLNAQGDCDAFCCSKSKEELYTLGHLGAIAWIERFEHGVNNVGKPLVEVLSRSRMQWYEMKDENSADIVTAMNPDRRLFFAKLDEPGFINQRLIGLKRKEEYPDIELNHALLNSLIGMFYIEAVGFGRGQGALDINSKTIKNAYMLNPEKINEEKRCTILEKFNLLKGRDVLSTQDELMQQDRIDFDHEVLAAYGIEDYYGQIKEALLAMQKMRVEV